jgi:hypothetical protein
VPFGQGTILQSTGIPSLVILADVGYIIHSVPDVCALGLLARKRIGDGGSNQHRCVR